ncbi:MAG: hypothetical protein ACRDQ5_21050, partial [Sciscionella sp.]
MTATSTEPTSALVRGWVYVLYRQRRWLWLVPAGLAAVVTLLVMVVLPPDQTLDNLGEWAFTLSPF